jgi:hypothetical protein
MCKNRASVLARRGKIALGDARRQPLRGLPRPGSGAWTVSVLMTNPQDG